MKKEEITAVAQLLTGMKDLVVELEKSQKLKNVGSVNQTKKEILNLQKKIDKIIL